MRRRTASSRVIKIPSTTSRLSVVGLTGPNAAGKGEVALYLRSLGYQYRSLSDILRDEAAARRLEPSREILIQLGREFREAEGAGVLGKRTAALLRSGNWVIDSIRNPAEIDVLRATGRFFLLAVDAPIETRFDRANLRGRNENAPTLDAFRAMENREKADNPLAQQLHKCLEMADERILNDQDLPTLHKRVDKVLKTRGFPTLTQKTPLPT